jgi:NitT/TauT family transport system ATP-binding protein
VTKQFAKGDEAIVALRELSVSIAEGSFVTMLGRSGCGKSTLLNMLAGLTSPSAGEIRYRDSPLTGPDTQIGYLTQHDTLMPWRDVLRNVEMPLEIQGGSSSASGRASVPARRWPLPSRAAASTSGPGHHRRVQPRQDR